jgi:hypothetical protein
MWIIVAFLVSCLILKNKYALYKWERCAQFMVTGIYLDYTKNSHNLNIIILAPFLWYILAGSLIELSHFLHTRKYKDMRNTWKRIEILRERADLDAIFKLLLKSETQEKKYLGQQWKSLLEFDSPDLTRSDSE